MALPTNVDIPFVGMLASSKDATRRSALLTFAAVVEGFSEKLRVLIDSGASHSFVRKSTTSGLNDNDRQRLMLYQGGDMTVRLADGSLMKIPRRIFRLRIQFLDFNSSEELIELPLSSQYDIILGMPWLERHQPWIDWKTKEVGLPELLNEERDGHDPASLSTLAVHGSVRPDQSTDSVALVNSVDA